MINRLVSCKKHHDKTAQRLISLLIILLISIGMVQFAYASTITPAWPEGPLLDAAAWILVDPETGLVLASHEADTVRSPASTTKILTALVAMEHAEPTTMMVASQEAINRIGWDYVRAGILAGEEISFSQLLELLMVTSANEAGYIIAENISPDGTFEGFNVMMNERAALLGIDMSTSQFTNPCGIEEESHYTTARSLSIIAQEAMKHPMFRETVAMKSIVAPDTNLRTSEEWQISHLLPTNELVSNPGAYGSSLFLATGIKTGFTTPAGRCLVSSGINPDGLELIAVVLGSDSKEKNFSDSRKLLEFGFSQFARTDLKLSGEYFGRYEVEDAEDNTKVTVNTFGAVSWLMPTDPRLALDMVTETALLPDAFLAPIEKGQVLGELQVFVSSELIGTVQLVADNDVYKSRWSDIRDRYLEFLQNPFLMTILNTALVLLGLLILLRIILKTISRRRNRRHYNANRKNNHRIDYFR